MIETITGKVLGILIGFALGAAFMAWMGSEPAKALFSRKKWRSFRKGPDLWKSIRVAPEDRGCSEKFPDLNKSKNFRTGIPDCPICGGLGYTQSLFKAGQTICTCTFKRKLYDRVTGADMKDGTPPDAEDTVDLTLVQSREIAARVAGKVLEPYITVHIDDIVRPKLKAMMEAKGVEKVVVTAQIAANLTGKTYKLPEQLMRAVWYGEDDLHLFNEFGHLLEERGPVTVRTYGPKTGRLSSSGSNLPRADEITEHSLDRTDVDEFGTIKGGEDEIERARRQT